MQNIQWCLGLVIALFCSATSLAQGPPITGDKPIMLGGNSWVVKNLTEFRNTDEGNYTKLDFMGHYLPTSNTLIAVHLPIVTYDLEDGTAGQGLGDVALLAKYQFYRKDKTGATFRMVAKTLQTLPTGKSLGQDGISEGDYQSYFGLVGGYESIQYGLTHELGYKLHPAVDGDELRYKVGLGLPLLKQTYPVNQINLHSEFQSSWYASADEYLLLFAQGVQYAKGQMTFEAAIQFPLIQTIDTPQQRNYSLLLGTRIVF